MKVYLAGPMRGIPDWNHPAFDEARTRWRTAGHIVYCPALLNRALPYGVQHDECQATLRHVIQMDLACLYASDAIAMLPGWEDSRGATAELAVSQFIGLKVYDAVAMHLLDVPMKPWGVDGAKESIARRPGACVRCRGSGASPLYWCPACDGNGVSTK